ncbi:MAG: hypothetical protein ACHQC8_02570 [Solirubrobacterales bacterium]
MTAKTPEGPLSPASCLLLGCATALVALIVFAAGLALGIAVAR